MVQPLFKGFGKEITNCTNVNIRSSCPFTRIDNRFPNKKEIFSNLMSAQNLLILGITLVSIAEQLSMLDQKHP